MSSILERVSKSMIKNLGGKDLTPVKCVLDATKFRQFSILRKKTSFWPWGQSDDIPVEYSLMDILEPSSSFPECVRSGPFHTKDFETKKLKADVGVNAGAEVRMSGEIAQSHKSNLEIQSVSVPKPNLEMLQNRSWRTAWCTYGGAMMSERVSGLAGCIYCQFKRLIGRYNEQAVQEWMPFLGGAGNLDSVFSQDPGLRVELELLQDRGKQLSSQYSKSRKLLEPEPSFLSVCRRRGDNLYVVTEAVELAKDTVLYDNSSVNVSGKVSLPQVTYVKGECQGEGQRVREKTMTVPQGTVLAYRKKQLVIKDKNCTILIFDDTKQKTFQNELSDTQLVLLTQAVEKRILSQQQELVRSILEPNFRYPWHIPITLPAELLALLQEEDMQITYALLEECGLKMELRSPRSTWHLDAKKPLSALYAALSMLLQLAEASVIPGGQPVQGGLAHPSLGRESPQQTWEIAPFPSAPQDE
ncbi:Gasdermin-C [Fukomys damarensis]|uniref:Gasdermin-C n=1 Tax=Fukomys damarensis TaxID=885580 RepID=A0A091D4X9_FUKDA|nr:Gasdermin-C [Fukomys damarensis]